jgi:hypothetical protein
MQKFDRLLQFNNRILIGLYESFKKKIYILLFKHRQAWNRKLIALEFTQVEAMEYAKLFVNNGVEISMIPELNDGLLKGIGIEKAGQ